MKLFTIHNWITPKAPARLRYLGEPVPGWALAARATRRREWDACSACCSLPGGHAALPKSSRSTASAVPRVRLGHEDCGPQLGRLLAILFVLQEIAHKKLRKIIVLSGMPDSLTRHEQKSSAYPCSGSERSHRKSRHAAARAFLRSRNRPESILVDKNPAAYALVDRWPTTTPLWGNPKTGSE